MRRDPALDSCRPIQGTDATEDLPIAGFLKVARERTNGFTIPRDEAHFIGTL
jgi:hypothetical protein